MKRKEIAERKEIAAALVGSVFNTAADMACNTPESLGEYEHEVELLYTERSGWFVLVGGKRFDISIKVKEAR